MAIYLRRNEKETQYFKHNNDVLEVGEIVILKKHVKINHSTIPDTVEVLISNQRERLGPYSPSLKLDINCFSYVKNSEMDELYFEKLEGDNFDKCPDWCNHSIEVPDMFSTGDSPTGYDCDCHHRINCPLFEGDLK